MKCPSCHFSETKVLDSRSVSDGLAIRRRRECLKCGFRFSTYEEVEILNLTVIKRNGGKDNYSREKLESGLKKALEKRPVTGDEFKKLIGNIERDIQIRGKDEIKTSDIGEIVMKRLKKLDEVAYIRFASVYQSFRDAETFHKEINKLLREGGKKKGKFRNKISKKTAKLTKR
jgi:transcriptional repressor NrdR